MRKLYCKKLLIKLMAKIRVISFSTRKRTFSAPFYPSPVESYSAFYSPGYVLSISKVEG